MPDAAYDLIDVGPRANTYGLAMCEMVNETWKRKGVKGRDLLPAWEKVFNQFGNRFQDVNFRARGYQQYWTSTGGKGILAPRHLGRSVRVLAGPWVERYAAGALWLTTVVNWVYGDWQPAVITAGCAGIVTGIAFARWARER